MGHPWPSAAKPASCRFTHAPKPAFGQRGLTGRLRSRSKAKARRPESRPEWCEAKANAKASAVQCRSWLACDADPSVHLKNHSPKCGSGLAREGGVSVDTCMADTPPSRASPLPHFGLCFFRWTEGSASQASQLLQKSQCPHKSSVTTGRSALDLLLICFYHSGRLSGRRALDLLLILILGAPLNHAGLTQALERG